jgi:WW domain-binding protein 2
MSINWVMLDASSNFVKLPNERPVSTAQRIGFSLTTPRAYPAQNPLNIQSSTGTIHLTNQRVIYIPEKPSPEFKSFSASLLNLHDTHISFPWFGPNMWMALVEPVPGGNIPQSHHIELKLTFKEGGAPDYHSNFERIKERLVQAVESARESNLTSGRQGGLGGVNMDAVHLDELPSYENSGQDQMAPSNAVGAEAVAAAEQRPPPESTSSPSGPRPAATTSSEPPPDYEDAQQQALEAELNWRLAGHRDS